jgi:hypothetical protein
MGSVTKATKEGNIRPSKFNTLFLATWPGRFRWEFVMIMSASFPENCNDRARAALKAQKIKRVLL